MLTEIEWWGGLLFIWMASCYAMVYSTFGSRVKFGLDFISTHLAFICAAFVLAVFFYPIETESWQYVYIGLIGLGVIATLLFAFLPDTEAEESSSQEDDVEVSEDEDVEKEKGFEIAAQLILFFPLIASFSLGIYKSSGFIKSIFY